MGCDIHIVVESRRAKTVEAPAGKWIGIYCTDQWPGTRPPIARRDYAFFARIAGVRGAGGYSKNLPEDISELAWREYMRAPTDHHNPSHMSASEFVQAYYEVTPPQEGRSEHGMYDLLGLYSDREDDFRVVFWFDN